MYIDCLSEQPSGLLHRVAPHFPFVYEDRGLPFASRPGPLCRAQRLIPPGSTAATECFPNYRHTVTNTQ
jgi:hypothetical protein